MNFSNDSPDHPERRPAALAMGQVEGLKNALVIAGPTASGKSALALALALRLNGEIVNADSRQIYRFLDAGTSKPGAEERARVPHHLYDFLDPKDSYSAGRYARQARPLLAEIAGRGRRPIVVGGTGLYLRALFEGLSELPERDPELRAELEGLAREKGRDFLHEQLRAVDPRSAEKIPAQNIQRVVRALEVFRLTGKPIAHWHEVSRPGPALEALWIGIVWPKEALRRRIEERSRRIFPGMAAEARALLERGYRGDEPGFQSLGYRSALRSLRREIPEPEALQELTRQTLAYAKRQITWFSADKRIHWLEASEPFDPDRLARRALELI